jgi:hypothetical protein
MARRYKIYSEPATGIHEIQQQAFSGKAGKVVQSPLLSIGDDKFGRCYNRFSPLQSQNLSASNCSLRISSFVEFGV